MAGSRKCLELQVSLKGTHPIVWRAFGVPADYSLSDLHEILQIVMGWHNSHCHVFRISGNDFSSDRGLEGVSNRKMTLSAAFKRSPAGFVYFYDMGDGWQHEVKLLCS